MIEWQWDQGRLLYFQYDILKEIACILVQYEGKDINDNAIASNLKNDLIISTEMPFAPNRRNYKINRNYSRVFQCALLSKTKGRGELVVSDICKELASPDSSFSCADDYLFEVMNRFRFPFPAFRDYNNIEPRIYPFCAILKFLIAKRLMGENEGITINDIGKYLIGNQCTGLEDIDYYKNLQPSSYEFIGDADRQVREMVVFFGQISILKIFDHKLYLDVLDEQDVDVLLTQVIKPLQNEPLPIVSKNLFL